MAHQKILKRVSISNILLNYQVQTHLCENGAKGRKDKSLKIKKFERPIHIQMFLKRKKMKNKQDQN